MERIIQYIKDRAEEGFDDYFPCRRKTKCILNPVKQWLNIFANNYNKEVIT